MEFSIFIMLYQIVIYYGTPLAFSKNRNKPKTEMGYFASGETR